jgi:hypothetical protein
MKTVLTVSCRDWLVGNITGSAIPSLTLTNGTTFTSTTSFANYTYQTRIQYVAGLLQNTSIGINHNITVQIEGVANATDGLVAILEVSITGTPHTSCVGSVYMVVLSHNSRVP